jgi:DNA-binding NarL/FixJ family response regulator
MERIKIVVAGDNYLFTKGMECLIEESGDFELVGVVENKAELIDKITSKDADVLAIDVSSIGWNEEVAARVRRCGPDMRILVFNTVQNRQVVAGILGNGVTSYLLLCCDKAEIMEALVKTCKGERFLCGKVVNVLINIPKRDTKDHDAGCPLYSVCAGVNISEREMEVIRCVAEGLSNGEIAERLFLSVHTVNTHRKNIMSKLGINNTAGLVMYAVRNQLVSSN